MPEPAFARGLRATVTLKSDTGFFRDAVVNTFHFDKGGTGVATDAQKDFVANALISFYNDVHGTGSNQIRWYLSSTLDNSTDAAFVKVYDMGDAHPRQPKIYPFTLGASAGSDEGNPLETALCLSFNSVFKPTRRGRGRIYLGPLHSNTVLLEAPNIGVNPATILAIQHGARFLMDLDNGTPPNYSTWSVYSRADNNMYPITQAFVDNEFDTQRRRGHRATVRSYA
jgi:hypothetical protein